MTATPNQIVNDLSAWSKFFAPARDDRHRLFADTAWMLRRLMAGEPVDGRTWGGLDRRQIKALTSRTMGDAAYHSLSRGRDLMFKLRHQQGGA